MHLASLIVRSSATLLTQVSRGTRHMNQIFHRSSKGLSRQRFALKSIPVRAAIISSRIAWFRTQLEDRPLVQTNDPYLPEILEPEHAHT